jgi:ketosteroid isomerase-like protein
VVSSIAETYLEKMVAHDFDAMAACLAEDVVRVGPYGDTYTPRDTYVAMLTQLMPSLPGYSMEISRVMVVDDRRVVVELSETVEIDGAPLLTPEALVFDLNDEGLIAHIAIYIQTLPKTRPVG